MEDNPSDNGGLNVTFVTSVDGSSADTAATKAGQVINYQIVVANTGDELLTHVIVTDQTLGTSLGPEETLERGGDEDLHGGAHGNAS